MVLVVGLDLAVVGIERDHRARVEIIAGMRIARPGRSIADAPIDRLGVLVVGAGHPGRPAAILPIVTLPGVVSRFALSRNGEGAPELLAVIGIECGDVTANPELA